MANKREYGKQYYNKHKHVIKQKLHKCNKKEYIGTAEIQEYFKKMLPQDISIVSIIIYLSLQNSICSFMRVTILE